MTWLHMQVAREITKERIENGVRNAQWEAQQTGYVQHPRRSFNVVAALTRLFQRRKSAQTPALETTAQRRTAQ